MYARTYSRASISFIISALKMSAEPAYPIGKRVFALWRNDGGHFDRSWAESNGVLTHVRFCRIVLISGIGYGLLTIRLAPGNH